MQNMEKIYKEYATTVYKYLFCLTHNEDISEELTQETFVIAVKEIKKFRAECKISVWLCQIAKHLWYKEIKKKNRHISLENISNDLLYSNTTEEIVLKKEARLKLFKDIQKLDDTTETSISTLANKKTDSKIIYNSFISKPKVNFLS